MRKLNSRTIIVSQMQKGSKKKITVPPILANIVQTASENEGNVNIAVEQIETKALKKLDSYLNAACMRLSD
jgi:hypothetical protein